MEKEGWQIADWLNANGFAAIVLKYRLPRAPGSDYTVQEHALANAARAMRMVWSRAQTWGIDPAPIGFMGFSAGGEIAALIETRFYRGNDAKDPIDRVSARPDFAVVVDPSYRPGTITVPKDAHPTLLVCADCFSAEKRSRPAVSVALEIVVLLRNNYAQPVAEYERQKYGNQAIPQPIVIEVLSDTSNKFSVDELMVFGLTGGKSFKIFDRESRRCGHAISANINHAIC